MNSKLISLVTGAALISASALASAGDFKYRGGFDDRHDRQEQRHERRGDDRGHHFSGRRHWAPIENHHNHHWKPRWKHDRHHHDRWCNHGAPRHRSFGHSYYEPGYDDGGSSLTFIFRGDLD